MSFKVDTAKIKRWREERHWSQEHLAELAGVGLRTIQRIETGQQASPESLKAIANAYQVDVAALYIDPEDEAMEILRKKNAKTSAALRLSFWIHLASWVLGMFIFVAISLGSGWGLFGMRQPMIWWSVGLVSHAVTVVIVELSLHYTEKRVTFE